jgi:hypothetical protein
MGQIMYQFTALSVEAEHNSCASGFFPPQLPPQLSESTKPFELRFRALLTEGGAGQVELLGV